MHLSAFFLTSLPLLFTITSAADSKYTSIWCSSNTTSPDPNTAKSTLLSADLASKSTIAPGLTFYKFAGANDEFAAWIWNYSPCSRVVTADDYKGAMDALWCTLGGAVESFDVDLRGKKVVGKTYYGLTKTEEYGALTKGGIPKEWKGVECAA